MNFFTHHWIFDFVAISWVFFKLISPYTTPRNKKLPSAQDSLQELFLTPLIVFVAKKKLAKWIKFPRISLLRDCCINLPFPDTEVFHNSTKDSLAVFYEADPLTFSSVSIDRKSGTNYSQLWRCFKLLLMYFLVGLIEDKVTCTSGLSIS